MVIPWHFLAIWHPQTTAPPAPTGPAAMREFPGANFNWGHREISLSYSTTRSGHTASRLDRSRSPGLRLPMKSSPCSSKMRDISAKSFGPNKDGCGDLGWELTIRRIGSGILEAAGNDETLTNGVPRGGGGRGVRATG